jgi:hypothetical protein
MKSYASRGLRRRDARFEGKMAAKRGWWCNLRLERDQLRALCTSLLVAAGCSDSPSAHLTMPDETSPAEAGGLDASASFADAASNDADATSTPTLADASVGPADGDTAQALDAAPPHPVSTRCGDAIRDPVMEECDDGSGATNSACTTDCRIRDIPVVNDAGVFPGDSGGLQRTLGGAPHVAAGVDGEFGVVYADPATSGSTLWLARFGESGIPGDPPLAFANDYTPLAAANPAIAPLASSRYAVAWADGTNGPPEVLLRVVDVDSLGPARLAHSSGGSHTDPDLLWVSDRLVAAWTNVLAVEYRAFDADLTPLGPEMSLAPSSAIQSHVALAPFANGWAAAFRSGTQGLESIVVQTDGATSWSTPPAPLGPVDDHPALLALDDAHLLVVFSTGTDPADTGTATVARLRAAILSTSAPGLVQPFPFGPLAAAYHDPSLEQRRPGAAHVGDQHYLSWESTSPGGGSTVFLTRVSLDPGQPNGIRQDEEIRVPYPSGAGWQSNVHLAASPLFPAGALISVWETASDGTSRASTDVMLDFRPSPFVFLGPAGSD